MSEIKWLSLNNKWGLLGILVGGALLLLMVGIGVKRVFFLRFVENYQLSYQYNWITGEATMLDRVGYHSVIPFRTSIYTIDLRPMQVCIEANDRVLNCKLVQFNQAGFSEFISIHGANNYEGSSGSASNTFREILKSYAYDGLQEGYPFLTVLREIGDSQPASQEQ